MGIEAGWTIRLGRGEEKELRISIQRTQIW